MNSEIQKCERAVKLLPHSEQDNDQAPEVGRDANEVPSFRVPSPPGFQLPVPRGLGSSLGSYLDQQPSTTLASGFAMPSVRNNEPSSHDSLLHPFPSLALDHTRHSNSFEEQGGFGASAAISRAPSPDHQVAAAYPSPSIGAYTYGPTAHTVQHDPRLGDSTAERKRRAGRPKKANGTPAPKKVCSLIRRSFQLMYTEIDLRQPSSSSLHRPNLGTRNSLTRPTYQPTFQVPILPIECSLRLKPKKPRLKKLQQRELKPRRLKSPLKRPDAVVVEAFPMRFR